jgi:caffeoyl-CoA O-methyltransferase
MSHMIQEPERYFRQFVPERDDLLKKMEEEAAREEIPIIGPVAAELLYILARTAGAKSILELGTATGYSGIYLARAAVENGGRLTTLEWSSQMASRARENFEKAGVSDSVEIIEGDALKQLGNLRGPFDFMFLDIDKEFYIDAVPLLHSRAKKGCLLVADNTGFKDSEPFNRAIAESDRWRCAHLFSFMPGHSPENDGLCFALAL